MLFIVKSSPVTLRRSGQQVRVPIHPSPSAVAVHPSGAIPVHPSPGGTLQEHEVFQQGCNFFVLTSLCQQGQLI